MKKAKPLLSEALAYSRSPQPEGGVISPQRRGEEEGVVEVMSPKKRLQSAVKNNANKHGSNMRSNRRPSENNNNTRGTGTPLNDTSMNRKSKGVS
jgi:hypothetical protein